jgi:recombinational DNA repair ATPase RecF
VVLATIGFGDLLPTHGGTKLWVILFSIVGVSLFSLMVGAVATAAAAKAAKRRRHAAVRVKNESLRTALDLLDQAAAVALQPEESRLLAEHAKTLWTQ